MRAPSQGRRLFAASISSEASASPCCAPNGLDGRGCSKAFLQMLDLIFSQIFKPQHLIAGVLVRALLSAAEAIGATLEGKTERQKNPPIRRILWPGWPGSLPDLVAGIATINRLAPRPCGPDGDNSKAWPRVLLSPRPLDLSQISESRRRHIRGLFRARRLVSPVIDSAANL
jgi:hypothetical protein